MAENKFRIPEESVDLILDSVNIVEVIEESIPLKKSGQNYFACCPFHKESTPSFSVSEYKQFYHCFGCGAHGDAIEFLKAYKKDSFVSAAMSLAHRGGINLDLPKESTTDYIPVGRIKETLGELAVKYQANLTDNRLPITRVSRSTAEYFGLGIALPESNLTNDFTSKDQRQWLLKSGLTTKANDDAFQNRLMLPLTDRKGEVVGFSGLTLDPNTESQDRTLYTTSEYFELDNHLYGEWQSLMSDSDDDHLFIVENVLYTLLFHDAGITNTIGTIFGIPNDQQLKRILRRSENITFIFNDTQKGRDNAEKNH
jgi:DNA primase